MGKTSDLFLRLPGLAGATLSVDMQSGQAYITDEPDRSDASSEQEPTGDASSKRRAATALAILIGALAAGAIGYVIISGADEGRRNSVSAMVSRAPDVRVVGGVPQIITGLSGRAEAASRDGSTPAQWKEAAQVRLILQRRFKNELRDVQVAPLPGGGWAVTIEIYSNGEPEKNHVVAVSAYQSLAVSTLNIRQITLNLYQKQEDGSPDLLVDIETPNDPEISH